MNDSIKEDQFKMLVYIEWHVGIKSTLDLLYIDMFYLNLVLAIFCT